MTTINVKGKEVKIHDDINEMSIKTFRKFNEYLLQDAGLGNKLSDVEKRFQQLDAYLAKKDVPSAIQERKNLHQTMWNSFMEIDHTCLTFGSLIHSIGGEKIDVTDIEDLKRVVDGLAEDLKYIEIKDLLEDIKKKYLENFINTSKITTEEIQVWSIIQDLKSGQSVN